MGITGFDLVGEDAELVASGFAQIGGVRIFEEQEKVEDVIIGKIQVDDACASAFPPARQCYADFAQTPASDEKVALLRIPEQFILKRPKSSSSTHSESWRENSGVSIKVSVTKRDTM